MLCQGESWPWYWIGGWFRLLYALRGVAHCGVDAREVRWGRGSGYSHRNQGLRWRGEKMGWDLD